MKRFITLLLALAMAVVPAITVMTSCDETDITVDTEEDDSEEYVYQEAIDNLKKVFDGDISKKSLKALMPNEVWNYLEIDDDEVKEILDESLYIYDDLSEDDIECVINVVDPEKLSKRERSDIADELWYNYDEEYDIEEAYELTLEIGFDVDFSNITSKDDRREAEDYFEDITEELDAVAVLIDGEWYFVDLDNNWFVFPGYYMYHSWYDEDDWYYDDEEDDSYYGEEEKAEDEDAAAEDEDWYYDEDWEYADEEEDWYYDDETESDSDWEYADEENTCFDCGEPIPSYRFYCDDCLYA